LRSRSVEVEKPQAKAQLLGSGAILNEVIKASEILKEEYSVASDIWSVTSYKELHMDALEKDRWNMLHPDEKPQRPYVAEMLDSDDGKVYVAASDYVKTLPQSIASWIPGRLVSLGTDGFGRSDSREALRDFFEVDAKHIVLATLHGLALEGEIETDVVKQAVRDLNINPEKANPMIS